MITPPVATVQFNAWVRPETEPVKAGADGRGGACTVIVKLVESVASALSVHVYVTVKEVSVARVGSVPLATRVEGTNEIPGDWPERP